MTASVSFGVAAVYSVVMPDMFDLAKDREGLLRPPSIVPPSVEGRSPDIFRELLHLLRGYPVHIRDEVHRAELLRLMVRPDLQGRGWGRAMGSVGAGGSSRRPMSSAGGMVDGVTPSITVRRWSPISPNEPFRWLT